MADDTIEKEDVKRDLGPELIRGTWRRKGKRSIALREFITRP